MKKFMNWMLAAVLICGATTVSVLVSCNDVNAQEDESGATVKSVELIRTSQS